MYMLQGMCAIAVCVHSLLFQGMCTIHDLLRECAQTVKNQGMYTYPEMFE